ncbi:MAG: catalase [Methanoregula sp.]|jgi:catalase|nr:catalase [Methanoregula sp.]
MARKTLASEQQVPYTNTPDPLTAGQHGRVFLQDIHLMEKQEMTL